MMKHCHNGQFMLDEGEDENVDVMGQNGNGDDGTSDNDGDGDDDDDDDDDDDVDIDNDVGTVSAQAGPAPGERIPGQVRGVPGGGRSGQQVRLDLQAVRISQRDGAQGGVRVHRLQVSLW